MNPFDALMMEIRSRPGDPRGREALQPSVVKKQREAVGARVHLMEDDEPPAPVYQRPAATPAPTPSPKERAAAPAARRRRGPLLGDPWGLSKSQHACLKELAAGSSSTDAAKNLCISEKTVGTHLLRARERMGLPSSRQAVLAYRAWKNGPETQEQPMEYEPRGKVAILADAMRADPGRIWSTPEVAKVMDVRQTAVGTHLDTAIRHGALHRRLENGRCQYALRPFLPPPPPEPRIPVFGKDFSAEQLPPQHGDETAAKLVKPATSMLWPPAATQAPVATSAPTSESAEPLADMVLDMKVEAQAQPDEALEPVEFNAALWADGDLVIYGAQENEDGSITLMADQTAKLLRLLHGQGPAA